MRYDSLDPPLNLMQQHRIASSSGHSRNLEWQETHYSILIECEGLNITRNK